MPVGNLTHHSYHATASANIAHVFYECKYFFAQGLKKVTETCSHVSGVFLDPGRMRKNALFRRKMCFFLRLRTARCARGKKHGWLRQGKKTTNREVARCSARLVIYRAPHEQRSSFRRKLRELRMPQDRGSAKRGAIRPVLFTLLSHKKTVPFRERSFIAIPHPARRADSYFFSFFSSFFGSSAGTGATYPSGCSSWTIAAFCIGMRQFLLLPNSTMTVSFVMSMTTP